jgi:hypothetical protein
VIKIVQSDITITCDTNKFSRDDTFPLILYMQEVLAFLMDIYAFSSAVPVTATINSIVTPEGQQFVIDETVESLRPLNTACKDDSLQQMLDLLTKNNAIYVLGDLVSGIRSHQLASINCSRTVDGIRYLIADASLNENQQWQQMRSKLRIERDYIQYISDISKDYRHANYRPVSQHVVMDILERTWTIMDRYLHYLKRGATDALPEAQFPNLKK